MHFNRAPGGSRGVLQVDLAGYHLRFKRPFGLAHGTREGTDALFLRLMHDGVAGYGEVTFPPYLPFSADHVATEVRHMFRAPGAPEATVTVPQELTDQIDRVGLSEPARSLVHMAYTDMICRRLNISVSSWMGIPDPQLEQAMVTLGRCTLEDIPEALSDLPRFPILKLKLGGNDDEAWIEAVLRQDDRPVLFDGNQGIKEPEILLHLMSKYGHRVIGIEQPFPKERSDLHAMLVRAIDVPVYGDESIQTLDDLERLRQCFTGVNIKLMKCGGLDRAMVMAKAARDLGMEVMLGSMSESSLGSTAMAHLSALAGRVDLDGPWLIGNDPFKGMQWNGETLYIPYKAGLGAEPYGELCFTPIGA